ncbi:metal/formaldehyde-sensitive transcriptional repressor [Sphingomonas parva]|uniref:Metal/formaldehyde-sensitive transcriptional repressor n=1 Tax=Sphingomonas parva TaxID=2555898 RepID=A0A4Y8ZLM1_9SPHN|nr:metal/formaldehyde-sensitive transcriptional repressor [Sphingomonas parva]TFI56864.1 metal/formaldehyde-sensitive transcriptional repressor [Sphingomonas parva]
MAHLSDNADLLARVRRVAGQLNAVERGLAGGMDCADLLQLVAAVRGAVGTLMDEIVARHLEEHVARPGLTDAERSQGAAEVMAAVRRYAR